ncbi:MAG TPA: bifunctional enoyl-CoA hydratase/phosphate acetyltransferase [Candidatus Cloacimonadota bacterium]|nr:bifunctional enoyl-CoA hydratase/phosphate acetyltransferase [Candidatus Cloacimonadota bacterium]
MIRNFDELLAKVKKLPNKTVAIAAAQSGTALEAALMAKRENIAESILVGDKDFITAYLHKNAPKDVDSFPIVDTGNDLNLGAREAVRLINEGKADILLKGKCDTATLLKATLDKENGLRTGEILSDLLVYEHRDKLILLTDGGINLYPNLEEKISIVKNAVKVAHGLEYENPKVALLAAVEVVNLKMQSTLDASIITQMNRRNQITGCVIDGPLAFDNAIDEDAAKLKGIKSEVAGKADVLVVPNIECGNLFGKSLTYYCNYRIAHVVMGAKAPIVIASRADTAEVKMLSMALAFLSV